jgi:uncharacterized SAM-binding protein YcdF (DUF218 family)
MRDAVTDLVHLFFTVPVYLLVLFGFGAVLAWRQGPQTPLHRWRFVLAILAALSLLLGIPIMPNAFVNHVERTHPVPTEAQLATWIAQGTPEIVVLSGGWFRRVESGYEVEMGSNSWERTWAAVGLWRRTGGTLIFTGAPLPDGSDSVAQHMATVALQLGVPASSLRVETHSRNTFENLVFTARQFKLRRTPRPIILLTSALHLPRAAAIARHMGLVVLPYPCDYHAERRLHWRMWLPSNDAYGAFEEVLHEWVGLIWYRMRGWA